MKSKNFALIFGIVFLFLAIAPLVSAQQVDAWLYFDGNTNANQLTINQGDSVSVLMVSASYGESMSLQKLEIIPYNQNPLYSTTNPGTNNNGVFTFNHIHSINTGLLSLGAGTYTLRFTAKTSVTQSTAYAEKTLIINPLCTDTVPPVITITGNDPETVTVGSIYTDAGATAQDNIDGNLDSQIQTSSNVNTNVVGTYQVIYTVTDSCGNTDTETRTVNVVPLTTNNPPVITLYGNNPQSVILGSTYTDAGAEANDVEDGGPFILTPISNNVNTNAIGAYQVVYSYTDLGGITVTATRIVNVIVMTPNLPSVTISSPTNGQFYNTLVTDITFVPTDANGNLNQCWYSLDGGLTFSSPVTCTDGVANIFTGLTANQGVNTWIVYANNLAGNVGSDTVTFTVDTIAPMITLITPTQGETLTDTQVTLSVGVNEPSTVTYSLDGGPAITMTETTPGVYESNQLNLNDGQSYTVVFCATDLAGNTVCTTVNFDIDEGGSNNGGNDGRGSDLNSDLDSFYTAEYIDQFNNPNPIIILGDEDPEVELNFWQRMINWFARLFGLNEPYPRK